MVSEVSNDLPEVNNFISGAYPKLTEPYFFLTEINNNFTES